MRETRCGAMPLPHPGKQARERYREGAIAPRFQGLGVLLHEAPREGARSLRKAAPTRSTIDKQAQGPLATCAERPKGLCGAELGSRICG